MIAAPKNTNDLESEDSELEDTGSEDTGSEDTGSEDTGSEDTGSEDTGSEDTESEETDLEDSADSPADSPAESAEEPIEESAEESAEDSSLFRRQSKIGGELAFVPPRSRMGRRLKMREWGQRGFVAVTPGRPKLRHRILPRTVIGISFMLLSMAVGAAFSGAAFYAYYDDRLADNERTVAHFVEGFDQQFTDAAGALDQIRVQSIEEVRGELRTMHDYVADAEGVVNLPHAIGESVWIVETLDEAGERITGSAFAVVGHRGGTALVTSYSLVKSSTQSPAPELSLVKGDQWLSAELWSWDPANDLAIIVVGSAIPTLDLAADTEQIEAVGARMFAMSGAGARGATASPGVLLDSSASGLQHTVPVGTLFQGGPLVNGDGKVLGMAALGYRPFGVDPGDVGQAPDVRSFCTIILSCSELTDEVEVAGEEASVDSTASSSEDE